MIVLKAVRPSLPSYGMAKASLVPPAIFGAVHATTGNGAILLDGRPAFPKLVWNQCPDAVAGNLAVGIDFFMGNGCGSSAQLATWLSGTAYAIGDAKEAPSARAGAIGTFLPDEWDTHLPNDFSAAEATPLARGLDSDEQTGRALLQRILYWTGGHPYLTQRLCQAVAEGRPPTNRGW